MLAYNASSKRRRHTLIIVRRMLTEPKTALAGVMLDSSFARFIASMAAFNKERALSWRFVRWDFASMVEGCESGAGVGCAERSEHWKRVDLREHFFAVGLSGFNCRSPLVFDHAFFVTNVLHSDTTISLKLLRRAHILAAVCGHRSRSRCRSTGKSLCDRLGRHCGPTRVVYNPACSQILSLSSTKSWLRL